MRSFCGIIHHREERGSERGVLVYDQLLPERYVRGHLWVGTLSLRILRYLRLILMFCSYTPEVMPDKYRGFGCGLTLAFGRVASLASPFIATWGNVYSSVPVFVCCGLFVVIGMVSLCLPFEPMDVETENRE